jgi:hypothetical protein
MVYYTIPALNFMEPFENCFKRYLPALIHSIDTTSRKRHTVVTDIEWVRKFVRETRMKVVKPGNVATYKDVLQATTSNIHAIDPDDVIVTLPIEYPQRTQNHVMAALSKFRRSGADSLLCRKATPASASNLFLSNSDGTGNPWFESEGGEHWNSSTLEDNTFEHSHFVSITKVGEVPHLNDWLWNEDTKFFDVSIDTKPIESSNEKLLPYGTDTEHEFQDILPQQAQ